MVRRRSIECGVLVLGLLLAFATPAPASAADPDRPATAGAWASNTATAAGEAANTAGAWASNTATAAGEPTASAPRTVRFVAGVHLGYRFDSAGTVTGRRTLTFTAPKTASATARATIPGRGIYLRIASGPFSGYWVHETTLAYLSGIVGDRTLANLDVPFAPATYLGYRFKADWTLAKTIVRALATTTTAHADRSAMINGRRYIRMADGSLAGYWVPGTTVAPIGVTCSAGDRPPAGSARVYRTIPTTEPLVALTFDMGGRLDPARAIVDQLLLERVCATIFVTGDAANTSTGTAILAIVRAHPELFEVGDHTMHHCDLVNGGGASTAKCPAARPSPTFVEQELTDAAVVIEAKAGQSSAPYWRPPYGSQDAAVRSAAAAAGFTKTFLWTVDTIDWRPVAQRGPTALDISNKILGAATPGEVVLMHLGGYNTLDSLPYTLVGLRRLGFAPTSISDILR